MQSNDYWVHQSAVEVVGKLDNTLATEPQLSAMNTPVRLRQQVATEALLKALTDSDLDLRLAAAEALGRIGDARLIGALVTALEDADPWVRQAAARALEKMGRTPADDPQHPQRAAAPRLQILPGATQSEHRRPSV